MTALPELQAFEVSSADKFDALCHLLRSEKEHTLVFARAERVAKHLAREGFLRPIALPASMGLLSEMTAAILFMIALAVLRSKPRLSIASITAPGAGSESL